VHLLYHCLEQPVLYQFTSWHPALHVPVLCTTSTFLCLRSRSFHVIHLFLNPLSRLLICAVIHHSPSAPISLHLTAVAPSCHPHIHHRHNTHTVTLHKLLGPDSVSFSFCHHLCCLELRIPSSCPSHIHPPASCRIKLIIHISFTRIPYIVAKPRSALQKRPRFTAERTSLHLLDPFPTCFVGPRSPLSLSFIVPWDLSVGNG